MPIITIALQALNWLRKNPWAALAIAASLALGVQSLRLKLVKADLATAQANVVTLSSALDQQNKAVDSWKATAQEAQAEAAKARQQALKDRQDAQGRAMAVLHNAQKKIPCPDAWKRLVQSLNYAFKIKGGSK